MTAHTDQPCPRTYLAAVALEDFSALGFRGLFLTPPQRTKIADLGDIRVHVNASATPEAVNRLMRTRIEASVAAAIGSRRGLRIAVDAAAGTGEVYLTPLGCNEQRAALIAIHTGDSPLAELGVVA